MMNQCALLTVGLLTCLVPATSFAETLGDPAPALTVEAWIKGKPVDVKDGKNIYVLQFCTLSRANDYGLTNLSQIQKKYRDKGVVAVVISDEPAEQLKEFVRQKGAKIDYLVAADDVRRTTLEYVRVFQQLVLPRAYIVGKDGKVLWYGHPMGGLDQVLDEITSGRYSQEQTHKNIVAREQLELYLNLARRADPRGEETGRELLAIRTNDFAGLCDLAFRIANDPYLEKRDVALANLALDRAKQLETTNSTTVEVNRAILLFQTGQPDEGLARAKRALASAKSQDAKTEALNCIHTMEVRLAMARTNQSNASPGKP
jgi:hypothetical protein